MSEVQQFSGKYGADQVRSFPNIYLGNKNIAGVIHAWVEIFGNSLDESLSGYGDKIVATIHEDESYSIRDYGRGVPLGWNPDFVNEDGSQGKFGWDIVYNMMYGSGKYVSHQDDLAKVTDWSRFDWKSIPYLFTVGQHGVGATAVQYTSEYMEVKSYYDGVEHFMRFESGAPVLASLRETPSNEPSGTYVRFKPDYRVFTATSIPAHRIETMAASIAMTSGIDIEFNNELTGKSKLIQGSSVESYLDSHTEGNYTFRETLHHNVAQGPFTINGERVESKIQVVVTKAGIGPRFGSDHYVNNQIPVSGSSGVHAEAVATATADFFKSVFKGMSLKVLPEDYASKFTVVVDTLSNDKDYKNQTKDYMEDEYVFEGIYQNLSNQLLVAYRKGSPWLKKIVADVARSAQDRASRLASAADRQALRKVVSRKVLPKKFTSCTAYEQGNYNDVELILTEGESAKTATIAARDANTQALYSLRGKMLNPMNVTVGEALKNQEISDIINICGCGMATSPEDYDFTRRKVNKIIIASDADDDGYHIRNLAFLTIWKFMPDFLYYGMVYVAETPKYGVPLTDGTMLYPRDDAELEAYKEQYKGRINFSKILRYKGLGQVNANVLHDTTFATESRRMMQVRVSPDDLDVHRSLGMMYDDDTKIRKSLVLDMTNPEGWEGYSTTQQELATLERKLIKQSSFTPAEVIEL